MKKKNLADLILLAINFVLFLIVFYFANNLFYAFSQLKGFEAFNYMIDVTTKIKISLRPQDILLGIVMGGLFFIYIHIKAKNRRKTRDKEEYGSARWGTKNEIIPYMDKKDFYNNTILSTSERIRLNGQPENYKYDRNKNTVIIGSSGSRKTRGYVIPNILQAHSSFVITDPKGDIPKDVASLLFKRGFKIMILNLQDSNSIEKYSMRYNPIFYTRTELDILIAVDTLIANTNGEGGQDKSDFWEKSEKILYLALIDYLVNHTPPEDRNFSTVLEMIREMEVREDDEDFKNPIDIIFEQLEEEGVWKISDNGIPYYTEGSKLFCVGKYKEFKLAAGKTAKSILISCAARLSCFGIPEIAKLTSTNEIDMHSIGEEKTALFIVLKDTDKSLYFLASMFYTQLFSQLVTLADTKYDGELPIHVRCILDEFANTVNIPNFHRLIATIRSRHISTDIILQSISQLKAVYKDNMDTILGNCDTKVFLGGTEASTLKFICEILGKETIDTTTTGKSKSRDESHSINYQRMARALMTEDELGVMDNSQCIVMIRGERPFKSLKYDLQQHPRYKETAKFDKSNIFNIEKYIKWVRHKEKYKVESKKNILDDKNSLKQTKTEVALEVSSNETTLDTQEILKKHNIII